MNSLGLHVARGLLAGTGVEAATDVAGVVAMNGSRARLHSLEKQRAERERNR